MHSVSYLNLALRKIDAPDRQNRFEIHEMVNTEHECEIKCLSIFIIDLGKIMHKLKAKSPQTKVMQGDMVRTPSPDVPEDPNSSNRPRTADALTEGNVKTIARLQDAAKADRTPADRMADMIASFCGRMTFAWVHLMWFGMWVIANVLPRVKHFDPYPFTFLTFIVSLEAIFLSTFILISQNHETRLSEQRSHLDLQINLLTEQENTKMLKILGRIAQAVGVTMDDDPSAKVMEEDTRPEKLVDQIDKLMNQTIQSPNNEG